jgi:hypothetical protein
MSLSPPLHQLSRLSARAGLALSLCAGACLVATSACDDDEPITFNDDGGGGSMGGAGGDGGAGGNIGGAGGEGGTPPVAPALRNPVDMDDDELAYQSLILMGHEPLGATTTRCSECHSLNRGLLGHWRDLTDTAVATCFADTTVPTVDAAAAALDCLRQKPGMPGSQFSTQKLGIYSAVAHLAWFEFVFDRANGGDGSTERDDFLQVVAMPKGNTQTALTQAEFDIIAEWFARGLPFMEELLPDPPPPGGCAPSISPEVASHIQAMETAGWRAENANAGLLMFGCAGASTPLDCLSSYPQASTTAFGANWEHLPGAKLRVLRTNDYASSFWTRSSADGRFVGHGGSASGNDATIVDLATDTEIAIDAAYDPGFFPDNSGFIFQGTSSGTGLCTQNLLSSGTTSIDFSEPECSGASQVGLYQHVGAALGGGDYWAVDGAFVSDDGGHSPTLNNPATYFDGFSDVDLTPMIFDGSDYLPKSTISVSTPNEGDVVMSKSSGLLMGRVAGFDFQQNGYRLRQVIATPNGNSYDVTLPEIGRYCIDGGKPGISYDERWAVLHRYVTDDDAVELGFTGPSDPGFSGYKTQGAANIYLLDLLTGLVRRITHMSPGQYALFPHFRSDGWIYFIVRTAQGPNQEHIVASDAALVVEQ